MRDGMITKATAFALVHLAHYVLGPFQQGLILFWPPSMFVVSLLFAGSYKEAAHFGWLCWLTVATTSG